MKEFIMEVTPEQSEVVESYLNSIGIYSVINSDKKNKYILYFRGKSYITSNSSKTFGKYTTEYIITYKDFIIKLRKEKLKQLGL
jgi:hypothetical protein